MASLLEEAGGFLLQEIYERIYKKKGRVGGRTVGVLSMMSQSMFKLCTSLSAGNVLTSKQQRSEQDITVFAAPHSVKCVSWLRTPSRTMCTPNTGTGEQTCGSRPAASVSVHTAELDP